MERKCYKENIYGRIIKKESSQDKFEIDLEEQDNYVLKSESEESLKKLKKEKRFVPN